jgi:FAD/FMN-containing dehydrogenase/Fe-S oxidoreductase
MDHDVSRFESDLRQAVRGEVRFDALTRGIHATDASFYQSVPRGVCWPVDEADALAALRVTSAHGVPVTTRGAGTSLSGQTFGSGLILDLSRHLDRVLQVNPEERWALVQPGVIRDRLNAQLVAHRLHFPPDPATTSRATIGGMIGNNSSGSRSILYGMTSHHVIALKVALIDGSVLWLEGCDAHAWDHKASHDNPNTSERTLYRETHALAQRYREEILARFPRTMRRVGGYALDHLVGPLSPSDDPPHTPDARRRAAGEPPLRSLARLICGSEGTLAVVLAAKINLEPLPGGSALLLVHHAAIGEALRAVAPCLAHQPSAVELLDDHVVDEARRNAATAHLAGAFEGRPAAVNVVEFEDATPLAAADRARALAAQLVAQNIGYAHVICDTPAAQHRVWELRKQGLGLLTHQPGPAKSIDFIDDAAIPIEHFPAYIEGVVALCAALGVEVPLYAHASVGLLHVKPIIDLHQPGQVQLMRRIAEGALELCLQYGGAFSGEHGDGIVRGEFVARQFGPQLMQAFAALKHLFDPRNLLNPDRVLNAPPMTSHLRTTAAPRLPDQPDDEHAGYNLRLAQVAQHALFAHGEQGGFGQAVEQCNGVGACRKLDAGTMCPSYMATRDEEHSTRGRANALRLAMTGQLPPLTPHAHADPVEQALAALASPRIKEALDLCLSCKACKQECPNAVDMAKLKADVAHLRHQRHGIPLSARILGNLPTQANLLAGPLAALGGAADWVPGGRFLLEKLIGVDRRRPLPRFSRVRLRTALHRAGLNARAGGQVQPNAPARVALFADTWTKTMETNLGVCAQRLLQGLGYQVVWADVGCCQRTRISQGLLAAAKRDGARTIQRLDEGFAQAGLPILCLEPSCASALMDDLADLIDDKAAGRRVAGQVQLLDAFLIQQMEAGVFAAEQLIAPAGDYLYHAHCHKKAVLPGAGIQRLLHAIAKAHPHAGVGKVETLDAGCCGMAGAYGYQHHDVSVQVAQDRYLPALRAAAAQGVHLIADGLSCRHQAHDLADLKVHHWVELVRLTHQPPPRPAS